MDNNTMSTVSQVLEDSRLKHADLEFRWTPDGFTPGNDNFIRRIPEKGHVEQLLFEL